MSPEIRGPGEAARRKARSLALLFGLLAGCGPGPGAASVPPAIVLVVVDSLSAGHTEPYGSPRATTPHLRALAAQGVLFETVRSQTAWTLPSVATLFTALPQEQHAVRQRTHRLPAEVATLAEHLRRAGYRTHAIIQNPIVQRGLGLERGFERFDELGWENAEARRAVRLALESCREDSARPLFLYLHLAPPHMPYAPPAPYRGAFRAPGSSPDDPLRSSGSVEECRFVHRQGLRFDDPRVTSLARRYDEHVLFADSLVGSLIEGLVPADPLLAVVSDHGEAFLEHGAQGHNATVYEEMVRVPWILRGPGLPRGLRVARAAQLQDVGPTLVELAGLAPFRAGRAGRASQADRAEGSVPAGLELGDLGRSQADALLAGALAVPDTPHPRRCFLSSRYSPKVALQLAVIEGHEKLVAGPDGSEAALFDLSLDPRETFDMGLERPRRKAQLLRTLLERHAARVTAIEAGVEAGILPASELSALGYASPETSD